SVCAGFLVCDRRVLEGLSFAPACVVERGPLEGLARDGELMVYQHDGFWQCADTVRDVQLLRALWDSGRAAWRICDDRRPAGASSPGTSPRRRLSDRGGNLHSPH